MRIGTLILIIVQWSYQKENPEGGKNFLQLEQVFESNSRDPSNKTIEDNGDSSQLPRRQNCTPNIPAQISHLEQVTLQALTVDGGSTPELSKMAESRDQNCQYEIPFK